MPELSRDSSVHPPCRIGILGTPLSSGNRGVQALAESLVRLCGVAAPGAEFVIFGSHRNGEPVTMRPEGADVKVQVSRWRMSFQDGLRYQLGWIVAMSILYRLIPFGWWRRRISASTPWIRDLEACALVGDVRGGDSFSDIYGLSRFVVASLSVWTVILVRGSIAHFPQTYGPFRTRRARFIARYLLRRSSVVIARDTESQRMAQELVGDCLHVQLSPDVAFALCAETPNPIQIEPPPEKGIAPGTIGMNVNGLMYNGGYNRSNQFGLMLDYVPFLHALVTRLLQESSGEILLVPHTLAPAGDVESDNDASLKLRASLPPEHQSRVRVVTGDYDCHGIKGIIGQCDFFVGSRMHSCIGALSQAIPCVGIAYSMKFKGVFASVGADTHVVDARAVPFGSAVESVVSLYIARETTRKNLADTTVHARRRLGAVFQQLVDSK